MNFTRYLNGYIRSDLESKMVFIGGPRQVGKTTLAKSFIHIKDQYLNWDFLADRDRIKSHQINPEIQLVVLDEIHKYAKWRTLVKGLYDKYENTLQIIVTGSARLDHYRKGGDSLFGRYHYHRLHPFSLAEIDKEYKQETLQMLLEFGGFPEPFLKSSKTFLKRWQRQRVQRVVYQDLNDLSFVKELSLLELLVDLLPSRIGSPLSIKSLQEDLEVSPNTVTSWIELLEKVYFCFRILPYGPPRVRAIKKKNKLYLWDWSVIGNEGARIENLIASHLLKYCHFIEDNEGDKMELRYLKDVNGREIDFIVIKNDKPLFAVEAKRGERVISKHLYYFRERTDIPKFYQVHFGQKEYLDKNIHVLPFRKFCQIESLP